MCLGAFSQFDSKMSRRSRIRVKCLKRLRRRSLRVMGADMEMKNLKLYMQNKSIIEENAKLRKKALFLIQENQALLMEIQNKKNI